MGHTSKILNMNICHLLKTPLALVVLTQITFTAGDFLARANMKHFGFCKAAFFTWWFLIYFILRQIGMMGQLYVFSSVELGKTMALFGAISIVLSNLLGIFLLSELLSVGVYIGITLAILAFLALAFL